MIETINKWKARQWIPVICGVLIVLRAIFPSLRIDDITLWLLILGAVVALIPDIGELISRIRKVKKGDFEIEFDSLLENLKRQTEETESHIESGEINAGHLPAEVQARINSSLIEPRAAIITVAAEIEERLQNLAQTHGYKSRGRYFSPRRTIEELVGSEKIDSHMKSLFEDFWALRNEAVHSHKFHLKKEQLFSLVDLGVRILKILYSSKASESQLNENKT